MVIDKATGEPARALFMVPCGDFEVTGVSGPRLSHSRAMATCRKGFTCVRYGSLALKLRIVLVRVPTSIVILLQFALGAVSAVHADELEEERARIAYETQRSVGHAQMPDTMYASTPSAPMPPHAATPRDGEADAVKPYLPEEWPHWKIFGKSADETAEDVFRDSISAVIQSKCINCHVEGGVSGHTRLVFVPAENNAHEETNLQTLDDFLMTVEDGDDLILNKIRGVSHGGGIQVAAGTEEYRQMEKFLGLLGGDTAIATVTPQNLFNTVKLTSGRTVLRRAALILAGRIPTPEEYASVREIGLRAALRNLMTGPGFHEFLIRASNDRLLTDRESGVISSGANAPLVQFINEWVTRCEIASAAVDQDFEFARWQRRVQYGARRAPLELIAHVVENDLPYTEILTADYVMANPWSAQAYGSDTLFDDPQDVHEFKPATFASHYLNDGSRVTEISQWGCGGYIVEPGDLKQEYPHAGVLNTKVFLQRYPTTATNRNRARSRWTYYHFLGVDIEKSASRTTDPDALADTNNPTLRNPACTVCHVGLDPIAGAYQNYADAGHYRANFGGTDSLDRFYKIDPPGGEDHLVEAGSWEERETIETSGHFDAGEQAIGLRAIRDSPFYIPQIGIDRIVIRDADGTSILRTTAADLHKESECGWVSSSQYRLTSNCILSAQVNIPRAGEYKVEVEAWDYTASNNSPEKLRIWLQPVFREGDTWYRDMLAPGFADASAPDADNSLQWLAEQIVADERFSESAVKFWWPAIFGAEVASPPEDSGDADFEALLLAANAQALDIAKLARGFRRGFGGGDPYNLKDLLVNLILSKWFRADSVTDDNPIRAVALRNAGGGRLLTPEELAAKTLSLTGFQWGRRNPSAEETFFDLPPIARQQHALSTDYAILYGGIDSDGVIERSRELTPVMLGVAQRHAVQVSCPVVLREFYLIPPGERRLFAGLNTTATPEQSGGESAIRRNLVKLYDKLFGLGVAVSSAEITTAYNFLVDVWNRKRESPSRRFFDGTLCNWSNDDYYMDAVPDDKRRYLDLADPDHIARTWVVVLAALLMDYRYLYL